jgi:hypothetical protein
MLAQVFLQLSRRVQFKQLPNQNRLHRRLHIEQNAAQELERLSLV